LVILDAGQKKAIEAAFSVAQRSTRAPIVCVLAGASADYQAAPLVWTGLLGLLTPWPLLMFTQLSAQRIFLAQIVVCFVASAALMLSPLRLRLTPPRARRAHAHQAALAQFHLRGLDRGERSGILVFVSLAERYARVIPAESAAKAIPQTEWQALVDALVADLRARGPADALATAAPRCATLLAPAFPPTGEAPQPLQHLHVIE
jgi:putative membrane protein